MLFMTNCYCVPYIIIVIFTIIGVPKKYSSLVLLVYYNWILLHPSLDNEIDTNSSTVIINLICLKGGDITCQCFCLTCTRNVRCAIVLNSLSW